MLVSDLQQIGGFLQFPPQIKLTAKIKLKYCWVTLNIITWTLPPPTMVLWYYGFSLFSINKIPFSISVLCLAIELLCSLYAFSVMCVKTKKKWIRAKQVNMYFNHLPVYISGRFSIISDLSVNLDHLCVTP